MPIDSLRASDDASKAVQQTPHRISLDDILAEIVNEEYLHPESLPSMTIAVLHLKNGFAAVGHSAPADPENFDRELGRKFAKENAIRTLWPMFAFELRSRLAAET